VPERGASVPAISPASGLAVAGNAGHAGDLAGAQGKATASSSTAMPAGRSMNH
jgi:hypothetical protein